MSVLNTETDITSETDTHGAYMESVEDLISKCQNAKRAITCPTSITASVSTPSVQSGMLVCSPNFSISKLSASFVCASFWESFEVSIHNNDSLAEIEKLNSFIPLLEGHALKSVIGLPRTSASYKEALTIFKNSIWNYTGDNNCSHRKAFSC